MNCKNEIVSDDIDMLSLNSDPDLSEREINSPINDFKLSKKSNSTCSFNSNSESNTEKIQNQSLNADYYLKLFNIYKKTQTIICQKTIDKKYQCTEIFMDPINKKRMFFKINSDSLFQTYFSCTNKKRYYKKKWIIKEIK